VPCNGNGLCDESAQGISPMGEYTCACDSGWTGDNCDEDPDACLLLPCLHGSTCFDTQESLESFSCVCLAGFEGDRCEVNVD